MSPSNHYGRVIPQDIEPQDVAETSNIAEPYTQTEIEDLLYGSDRPATERLARLRELRDEAVTRESGDWGDEDPASLRDELDRVIDELSGMMADGDDTADYAGLEAMSGADGTGRLDTLAPDDVDERAAIEGDQTGDNPR